MPKIESIVEHECSRSSGYGLWLFSGTVCSGGGLLRGDARRAMDGVRKLSPSANLDYGVSGASLLPTDHGSLDSGVRASPPPISVKSVMRIDYNTSDLQRGKFARIAVNVDLTKPLVSKFTIDGEEFKVEYENLNELCIYCGMYGHLDVNCIRKPKDKEKGDLSQGSGIATEVPKDTYGPWMIVEKRKRQMRRNSENNIKENIMPPGGSRFKILQDANLELENDRDESLALMPMPLAARDTNIGHGQWTFRKNKGKQVINGASKSWQVRGESLKNSKPAKSTIGDFIEYKQRQQNEELVTKQPSTLDPRSHIVMRGDMCGSKNSGKGSTREPEADGPDPNVEQRLTQAFGRPPDRETRDFDENDVMELEENGSLTEGIENESEGGYFIDERDERCSMDTLERD